MIVAQSGRTRISQQGAVQVSLFFWQLTFWADLDNSVWASSVTWTFI